LKLSKYYWFVKFKYLQRLGRKSATGRQARLLVSTSQNLENCIVTRFEKQADTEKVKAVLNLM
jgi:hypothetical protein